LVSKSGIAWRRGARRDREPGHGQHVAAAAVVPLQEALALRDGQRLGPVVRQELAADLLAVRPRTKVMTSSMAFGSSAQVN
jgi:hypothetical protein